MQPDIESNKLEKYLLKIGQQPTLTAADEVSSQTRVWNRVTRTRHPGWTFKLLPVASLALLSVFAFTFLISGLVGRIQNTNTTSETEIASTIAELDKQSSSLDSDLTIFDNWLTSTSELNAQY